MKILLFGKNGQVGWELQRALAPIGEVVALDRRSVDHSGDLSSSDGLRETIRAVQPDVIVNAAAYTEVDKAESDQAGAWLINADAPKIMAEEAEALGAWLIHYSTDYVFDGSGEDPWGETSKTAPVNFYGASKLAGEEAIIASGCAYLIFRTSWVFSARGKNFARTMLRLAESRESLSVIADQIGAPTGADLLADVTAHAILAARSKPSLCGTYHLTAGGEVSWHAYAKFVIDYASYRGKKLAVRAILPIPSSAYPTPAARPRNSRMNTQKLRNNFSLYLPSWEKGVLRMLDEIL